MSFAKKLFLIASVLGSFFFVAILAFFFLPNVYYFLNTDKPLSSTCSSDLKEFDYRNEGLKLRIKEQIGHNCNTYASFTIAEYIIQVKQHKIVNLDLITPLIKNECFGLKYCRLATEECLNNEINTEDLIDSCNNHYKLNSFFIERTNTELSKNFICQKGPVKMFVYANPRFSSAVMTPNSKLTTKVTNHAVIILGWNEKGWIVQNSWGTDWGSSGVAVIPYESNLIGKSLTYLELIK